MERLIEDSAENWFNLIYYQANEWVIYFMKLLGLLLLFLSGILSYNKYVRSLEKAHISAVKMILC